MKYYICVENKSRNYSYHYTADIDVVFNKYFNTEYDKYDDCDDFRNYVKEHKLYINEDDCEYIRYIFPYDERLSKGWARMVNAAQTHFSKGNTPSQFWGIDNVIWLGYT